MVLVEANNRSTKLWCTEYSLQIANKQERLKYIMPSPNANQYEQTNQLQAQIEDRGMRKATRNHSKVPAVSLQLSKRREKDKYEGNMKYQVFEK